MFTVVFMTSFTDRVEYAQPVDDSHQSLPYYTDPQTLRKQNQTFKADVLSELSDQQRRGNSLQFTPFSHLSPLGSVIAQWENECISLSALSMTRVQFPVMADYFKRFFPSWLHYANPFWASVHGRKWLNLPSMRHTTCGHRGERLKFNHGQTMAEVKKNIDYQCGQKLCLS